MKNLENILFPKPPPGIVVDRETGAWYDKETGVLSFHSPVIPKLPPIARKYRFNHKKVRTIKLK